MALGSTQPLTEMSKVKVKAVPLQAHSGPEVSRKISFPDFVTTAQDGVKFVSLTNPPHLPQGQNKDGRCVRLTTLAPSCAVVRKFGKLKFLEPSGPLRAFNGTAYVKGYTD